MPAPMWLSISSQVNPPGDLVEDSERYERGAELYNHLGDRIERCFDGSVWLMKRFPPRSYVRIDIRLAAEDAAVVESIRTKNFGGPKEILCRILIPATWFQSSDDALLAVRLLGAILLALRHVGVKYDLGVPPLRAPKKDPRSPVLTNPFLQPEMPAVPSPSAASAIEKKADSLTAEHLLVAARRKIPRTISTKRDRVIRALGVVEEEDKVSLGQGEEVQTWLVRLSR